MTAPEETKTADAGGIEQWDLTSEVSPYLDRHMMFPLLEFVETLIKKDIYTYKLQDVAAARLALLRPLHMVNYAIDVYKSVHGEDSAIPAEMEQEDAVLKQLEELEKGCAELSALFDDESERTKLIIAGQWNADGLASAKNISADEIETYRELARYKFDCGDYEVARDMLKNYISLAAKPPMDQQQTGDEDEQLIAQLNNKQQQQQQQQEIGNPAMYYLTAINSALLKVLWGRLGCEILHQDWEASALALEAVKTAIETMVGEQQMTSLEALQQRTWLLHWSLFVYWNDSTAGLEHLVELFLSERYRQAITTAAPHLLRYLTAAVLLCKRTRVTKKASSGNNVDARRLLKNLIYVMEDCEYTDPIVEFVDSLCVKFDFDSAQTKLAECKTVLKTDFFLCHQTDLFMEEARVFVFENYCRIHNKIDLTAVSEKLAMDQDAAERWIVDLIRNADLPAKIDCEENSVVMGGSPASIYEQVMDRTRDLNVRSATLAQNFNSLLLEARKEKAKKEKAARDAAEEY